MITCCKHLEAEVKYGAKWRWSNSVGWSLLRNEMPSGEIILKTIEISIDSNSTCKKYQELSRSIRSCGFHACEVSHRRYLLELAPCPAEVSCRRLSWTWKAQIETNRSAFRAFAQVKCACIILYHLVSFSFVQMPFRFAGRERNATMQKAFRACHAERHNLGGTPQSVSLSVSFSPQKTKWIWSEYEMN